MKIKKNQFLNVFHFFSISIILSTSIFLNSCLSSDDSKIQWVDKKMNDAVKLATSQKKPLFVYWGAVWCPPCNVLKSTVFKNKDFIKSTNKYVSVYLDGDTEDAQSWGEKLKVRGYPTLMVLTPKLKEVVRLNSSGDALEMAKTLDVAYQQNTPTLMILESLLKKNKLSASNEKDLLTLKNHSWWQDTKVNKDKSLYSEKLFQLDKLMDNSLTEVKSFFFMTALSLKLSGLKEKESISKTLKNKYKSRVTSVLKDKNLILKNLESIFYSSDSFFKHLTSDKSDKNNFVKLYLSQIDKLRNNKSFSMEQTIESYSPLIGVLEDKNSVYKITNLEKNKIKNEFLKILKTEKDSKKRVNIISTTGYLFYKLGFISEAEKILKSELNTAINPYYVMSTLGYFEKEKGNKKEALSWYKKAYENVDGPASKLQWHGKYIRTLIKLSPTSTATIKSQLSVLYSNNIKMSDAFMGRNLRVLQSIKKDLLKWSKKEKQKTLLNDIITLGKGRCKNHNFGDFYKKSCTNYFNSLTL